MKTKKRNLVPKQVYFLVAVHYTFERLSGDLREPYLKKKDAKEAIPNNGVKYRIQKFVRV